MFKSKPKYPKHLSPSFSGALRTFSYFMASGSMIWLEGVDYLKIYGEEPSAIEKAYAIFANVIELDPNGNVVNAKYAEQRACEYLRSYCVPDYQPEKPFEDWETVLN